MACNIHADVWNWDLQYRWQAHGPKYKRQTKVTNYQSALVFFADGMCKYVRLVVLLFVDQTSGGKQLMKGQRDKKREEAEALMNNDKLALDSSQAESPGLSYLTSPTGAFGATNAREAMRSDQ